MDTKNISFSDIFQLVDSLLKEKAYQVPLS